MTNVEETIRSEGEGDRPLTEDLQVRLSEAREVLAEFDERTRLFVRDHPVASGVGAVAAGFFLGRLIVRR